MSKVLLLNPAFYGVKNFCRSARWFARSRGRVQRHPDYLAIATAVLEQSGHACKLVDAACTNMSFKDVERITRNFKPDMIVTYATTPSIYNDINQTVRLKRVNDSMTVLIGAHASALPIDSLNINEDIDVVAKKEFDFTLKDLASVCDGKLNLEKVQGITYRKESIRSTQDRPFIENLDKLPFPAWHHINVYEYFDAGKLYPFITLIGGRGCPNRCTFCILPQVMYGRRYRFRSAKNIVNEIEYDLKLFPDLKEIMFEDDTLTVDRKRCEAICNEIIDRNLDISWSANSRAELFDLQFLRLMKRSGCRMLVVGFEFGCQEILNNVKKGTMISIMNRFSMLTKKAGIKVHGCFMIGGPGETRETAEMTLKFAKKLNCDTLQFAALTPYPGTEFYDWCEKNGFLVAKDWREWVNAGEQSSVVSYPQLDRNNIVELCDKGLFENFYFRPSVWFYHLECVSKPLFKPSESQYPWLNPRRF